VWDAATSRVEVSASTHLGDSRSAYSLQIVLQEPDRREAVASASYTVTTTSPSAVFKPRISEPRLWSLGRARAVHPAR